MFPGHIDAGWTKSSNQTVEQLVSCARETRPMERQSLTTEENGAGIFWTGLVEMLQGVPIALAITTEEDSDEPLMLLWMIVREMRIPKSFGEQTLAMLGAIRL